jgi:hypothetical protein
MCTQARNQSEALLLGRLTASTTLYQFETRFIQSFCLATEQVCLHPI